MGLAHTLSAIALACALARGAAQSGCGDQAECTLAYGPNAGDDLSLLQVFPSPPGRPGAIFPSSNYMQGYAAPQQMLGVPQPVMEASYMPMQYAMQPIAGSPQVLVGQSPVLPAASPLLMEQQYAMQAPAAGPLMLDRQYAAQSPVSPGLEAAFDAQNSQLKDAQHLIEVQQKQHTELQNKSKEIIDKFQKEVADQKAKTDVESQQTNTLRQEMVGLKDVLLNEEFKKQMLQATTERQKNLAASAANQFSQLMGWVEQGRKAAELLEMANVAEEEAIERMHQADAKAVDAAREEATAAATALENLQRLEKHQMKSTHA